jgi:hypothetical protein
MDSRDPHYALAYAGMADSCILIPFYSAGTPLEYLPRARAAAQKAVELDDTLAEAHTSLAYVFYVDFENAKSMKDKIAETSALKRGSPRSGSRYGSGVNS